MNGEIKSEQKGCGFIKLSIANDIDAYTCCEAKHPLSIDYYMYSVYAQTGHTPSLIKTTSWWTRSWLVIQILYINNKLYELRLVDLTYHFVIGQL